MRSTYVLSNTVDEYVCLIFIFVIHGLKLEIIFQSVCFVYHLDSLISNTVSMTILVFSDGLRMK